jgi:hypothetical protein
LEWWASGYGAWPADQLAEAIYRIGNEERLETEIPQAVLDKLAELGMVHLEVDSPPTLTEHGQRTSAAMETGDPVPEFDAPD